MLLLFRLCLILFSFSLFAQYPAFLPVDFYTNPGYAGATQTFGGSFWGDMCRSNIQVSRTSAIGGGTWISTATNLNFTFLSQRAPDLTTTDPCTGKSIHMRLQYFVGTTFTVQSGPLIYPGNNGTFTGDINNFTFASRPGNSYAVEIKFAPMLGAFQDIRLKFDNVPPDIVEPNSGVISNNWGIPRNLNSTNGYFNLADLRSDALGATAKYLQVFMHDEDPITSNAGSGIWTVRANYDESVTDTTGFQVFDGCAGSFFDSSNLEKVKPALSVTTGNPAPLPACPSTTTTFPQSGFAPANNFAAATNWEKPFEVRTYLDFGDPNGSAYKDQGTYADGLHVVFLQVYDMAGNGSLMFYPFNSDRYAPCDGVSHTCVMKLESNAGETIDGVARENTFKLKLLVAENGSGFESTADVPTPTNNIKLFVVNQITNSTVSSLEAVHPTFPNVNMGVLHGTNLIKDRSCENLISDASNNYWNALPIFYQGLYNPTSTDGMEISIDLTGKPDGTYWFLACLRDKAGNWSMLIDKGSTSVEAVGNIHRKNNKLNLSMYNANTLDHDFLVATDAAKIIQDAFVPSLKKRLFFDKPINDVANTNDNILADGGTPCVTDPCPALRLIARTAYYKVAEIDGGGRSTVRIAYSPVGFTNAKSLLVGIKLPVDLSGIKGVHYKIGSTPPNITEKDQNLIARDVNSISNCSGLISAQIAADAVPRFFDGNPETTTNWVDFCFTVVPQAGSSLYIWLEDNAGNNNYAGGFVAREMFIDLTAPGSPNNLIISPNPSISAFPKLDFDQAVDASGIKDYKVCYWLGLASFKNGSLQSKPAGSCPISSDLAGQPAFESNFFADVATAQQSYIVPASTPLAFGRWHFSMFARDNAGNISNFTPIYEMTISDGTNRLSFAYSETAYSNKVVDPPSGSSQDYTFKVNYTDLNNTAPTSAFVKIDLNNDGSYQLDEKFQMFNDQSANANNNLFWDGEIFSKKIYLKYNPSTEGKITYSFEFSHVSATATSTQPNFDFNANHILQLDPYDVNSFDGMMQVRNNYSTPNSIHNPIILIKKPVNTKTKINLYITNAHGKNIKYFYKMQRYEDLDRYITWNLQTEQGKFAGAGLYYVVYEFGNGNHFIAKIIIVR